MACDGCGAENREGASFCASCGSPLARRCPSCAREVAADARFCDGCGTPLADEAAPVAPVAVRKTVTAVFADLGGSTGFGERVDAETARSVIGRYHALLQEVVDAHGGTVAKFIGDGMLAFFGIPEVAEDDAERAVAMAAEAQRRFAAFADDVADAHGERLTLRVGVNSGEVVIGEDDADIVGDALNVAARLEKACEPGRVLVGEPTWRLTRASFGFEPLGEVSVTGRAEPVAAYVLTEDQHVAAEATPFVGRDDELARLRGALDDAVAARAARFVTVIGPPGVGKTRLSRELEESVEAEARTLHTACERAGGAAFAPLVDLIRPALGDGDPRAALAALVPAGEAERDRVVDGLAGIVGVGEPRSTEETFWAVRRMVESLAANQPLILVIDDIQWAEARLLDLLEHLAEWATDAPLLLVGLARPELRELRPALAEPGRRVADVLVLDGLDAAATAQLASRMLGDADLPPELVARLPDSTDGNPLFVRELVRMLVDEGVVRREGDDWRLTVDVDAVEVPPTIRSLLAARIERLPAAERSVLERASVIGRDFVLGALRDLVEDEAPLDGHLEALRRRDLVEPTGAYWGDDPVWRFHHVLIRDAVYGRLLKETRADLHERVAAWTAEAAAGVVGEHETAIAHHYEQARGYRSELGVLDEQGRELGRRAADLLAVAARRALAQDDLVAAGSLAVRALACVDGDAAGRGDLLLLALEALLASGEPAEVPTLLDDLAARGAADSALAAWADIYRAQWLDLTDPTRLDEVERLADEAADRFAAAGDGSGQAKAHLVRASALARRGRLADSEVELDRAMGAARQAEDRRRLVAALGAAPAVALWGPSPVARAGGRCLDVIRLLRITTRSPVVEATSLRHQAVLEALRGRFEPARSLLAEVRATVEDLGLRRDLMEVELFEGTVDLLDGDPAGADGHLRTAHEGLAALGAAAAGGAAALLARALLAQGRVDDAATLADEVGATAGQDLKAAIAWGSVTAEVRAARGDAAGAVAAAEEAVALAGGTDLVLDHADALAALARVRRATGDAAGAESAEAEARRRYEEKGSTVHGGASRVLGAGVAAARGRPGADEPGAERPSENAAVRHHIELRSRWAAEDWDALGELLAPDMRNLDRRQGLRNEVVGRDEVLQNLQLMAELAPGGRRLGHTVVAVRDDRLALIEISLDHESFETSALMLLELDDSGRMSRSVWFDPNDLDAAMAELEARHRAQAGENAASRQQRELTERWQADGPEAIADMLSVDHVSVDHRRGLGGETRGRVETVEQMRVLTDLLDGATLEVAEVIATRGDRLAIVRMGIRAGFEVDLLVLTELDDDGRRRCFTAQFDADDLDAAMTEMEARYRAQTGEENLAARATRELVRRWFSDGPDTVMDRYAADCRLTDKRLGSAAELVGREGLRAQLQAVTDLIGDGLDLREVVAQRGEHLVLFRQVASVDGFELEMLSLVEVDADGRQVAATLFDPDDLDAATAELDARHAELAESRAVQLNRALIERWMADGADAAADLIAEDIHFEDRRAGLGTTLDGREAHLANMRAVDELRGGSRFVHREVVATRGERLVLARQAIAGDTEIELLALAEFDADGRMCVAIMFDADDLDSARAELDERYAAGAAAERESESLVVRKFRRCFALASAGDVDGAVALFADDVVNDDRRRGLREVVTGRPGLRVAVQALHESLRGATIGVGEVVAGRGEHLALVRNDTIGSLGLTVQSYAVIECDADGQLKACVVFDLEALDDAVDELDRRFAEGEGAAHADDLALCVACGRALAAGDAEALDALLADDFVLVDHLPLRGGFGEISRAEFLLVVADRPAVMGTGVGLYRAHRRIEPGLVLSDYELRSRSDRGFEATELGLALFAIRGGRIDRIESFPVEDREAAEARFEQLSSPQGPPTNLATRWTRELIRRWMADGPEAVRDLLWDDHRMVDHRPGLGSATEGAVSFVDNLRTIDELRGEQEFELFGILAQRGSRLALVDQGFEGDLEVHTYVVNEVDDAGLGVRSDVFEAEDLATALAELDRRYAAGEGSAHAEEILLGSAFSQAVATGDTGALAPLLADDYVSIDHRLIGFGELDRETTLVAVAARADTLGSGVTVSSEVRVGPGLVLAAYEIRTRSSAGSDLEDAAVSILQVSDGQVVRLELFDEGDWAAAEARFDELGRAAKENLAARRNREVIRRWMSDGPEAVRGLVTEDYHLADHRPGLTAEHAGVDALVDHLGAIDDVRGEQEFEVFRVVAQRGRRLALLDQGFDGDLVAHTYVVSEVDDDGLGVRVDGYEPEDLAAALAELDRRYLAGEGAEHPAVVTVVSEWTQRMGRRDWEATAALMSPTFVAVDHRTMGHGEVGFEERLARDRALAEAVPGAITFITDVLETAPRAALLRGGWLDTAADGAGFGTGSLVVVTVDAEGRMHRLEAFPEDDLPAARTCFEHLRAPV